MHGNGDHACASCKHQRKKCKGDCLMAPFFPVNLNAEFRSVHKTFGVSNVAKQLKKLDGEENRRLCAEALIWVATCFENDPVQGPRGEYQRLLEEHQRVVAELGVYKAQEQYYSRFMASCMMPPAGVANSQDPTNYCSYNNQPPPAGTVAVVSPNGQVLNNGRSGRAAAATTNSGCPLSPVAGYNENGSLMRVDDHHHGGPMNVQFPYHHNTENNGNGVVQDSCEGQDDTCELPVINLHPQQHRRQQQQPPLPLPPPPSQLSFVQLMNQNQNIGNKEYQDQKHIPNGIVVDLRQLQQKRHHQQQHNYPTASFSQQQSFNIPGQQYHRQTSSDANPARSSTTTTNTSAGDMDNGSRWTGNSL